MPKYEVTIRYEVEDVKYVEADSYDEALFNAEQETTLYAAHEGGPSVSWDYIEAIEAVELSE